MSHKWQNSHFMRQAIRRSLTILVIIVMMLSLASCGKQHRLAIQGIGETPNWYANLGDDDYLGDLIALTYEQNDDETTGVHHRSVTHLDQLLADVQVPLILTFYDDRADHAHQLLPFMENLAATYPQDVCIILVKGQIQVPAFQQLDRQWLPMTYWIKDKRIIGHEKGLDEALKSKLIDFIQVSKG